MQCEGSVRDLIRLAALAWTNQVGRPSGLGINTGAFPRPPERRISQTVAGKEKNGGGSLVSSRSMRGTAVTAKAVRPFLFYGYSVLATGYRLRLLPVACCLLPGPCGLSPPPALLHDRVRIDSCARLHIQYEEWILDTGTGFDPGEVSVSQSTNASQRTETRSWGRTHRESDPSMPQVYTDEGRGKAMIATDTRSVMVVSADTERAGRFAETLRTAGSNVTVESRGARAAELAGGGEGSPGFLMVDLDLPELDLHRLREALGETEPAPESLEVVERRQIAAMLRYTSGNRRKAAQLLGLARSTLLAKIRRYGLEAPAESEV